MPFTPVHIVAVLPFSKVQRLPFSALALGSMVPDFPLFFPIAQYAQTHSIIGLFYPCLPLGMLLFFIFHLIVKIPLIALAPRAVQKRLMVYSASIPFSIPVALSLIVALLVGSGTHIIWDAFTHQGRWGTQLVPVLNSMISVANLSLPGYKVFQYGSTVLGFPVLMFVLTIKLLRTPPLSLCRIPQLSRAIKLLIVASFLLIPIAIAIFILNSDATLAQSVGFMITKSGALVIIAILMYSLLFHWCFRSAKS